MAAKAKQHHLAFDLGASSGKFFVSVYDGEKLTLEEIHRFDNYTVNIGGSIYWDFPMLFNQYVNCIKKALVAYPTLSSVGVDSFCNDFSLINACGDPMIPMRSYRDPRTIRNEEKIFACMSREELYRISGNQIAPFNTLMQLAAMRFEERGGLLEDAWQLMFLPDLLTYLLTGERYTERTLASVSQIYDHYSRDWSDEALLAFGIERRIFAPFIDAGTFAGEINPDRIGEAGGVGRVGRTGEIEVASGLHICAARGSETAAAGFGAGSMRGSHTAAAGLMVCAVPEHDTAAAFMAARADKNTLVISSGTWMLVGCETESPIINDFGFRYNIANEGGISGRHRLIRNLMGFWILQEIRREFLQENVEWDFGALAETAGELPSFRWLFDVDLPEFFHPGDMRRKVKELCARIYGSAPATPAEYTEAVCASLAFKARWAMEKIETLVGRRFKRINIIGGASMNPYVAQTVADLAALPVVCGPTEASALGNVMFQMIAFGEIAGVREGRDLIGGSLPFAFFEPKAAPGAREAYARFVETFEL